MKIYSIIAILLILNLKLNAQTIVSVSGGSSISPTNTPSDGQVISSTGDSLKWVNNGSAGAQTPWGQNIAGAFFNLNNAGGILASNVISTNNINVGSNGVSPAGITINVEGAARINGSLSVTGAVVVQGATLTLPTGSITIPAGTVTANLFSGNGGSITAIPETGVTGLTTDLSQRLSTNDTRVFTLTSGSTSTSFNTGSNGVAPSGIVLDAEGATRLNGTLSVSNTSVFQGLATFLGGVSVVSTGTNWLGFTVFTNWGLSISNSSNVAGSQFDTNGFGNMSGSLVASNITANSGIFGNMNGTNFSYIMTTNAINTGVITCGKDTITNLTGNITLGGFANLTNNATCSALLTALNTSGSDRTVTLMANVTTFDGTRVYTVTNNTQRVFSFKVNQGVASNMASSTFF